MPTVPLSQGPKLRTNAIEGGFQRAPDSDAAFGGTAARQMGQLARAGSDAMEQVDQVFQRRAVDKAFEIDVAVGKAYQKKRGDLLAQRQLNNAQGVTKDIETWWDTDAKQVMGDQTDPHIQKMVAKSLARRKEQSFTEFTNYERGQLDKVGEISYQTLIDEETPIASGFIAGGDEVAGAVSMRKMEQATRVFMESRGVPPATIDAEVDKRKAVVHGQVIDGFLSDPRTAEKAKEYFARNHVQALLSPKERVSFQRRITEMVETQVGAVGARSTVDELMKDKDEHAPFAYSEAEKTLIEKYKDNPAALQGARAELDRAASLYDRNQRQREAAGADGAYELLNKGASISQIKGSRAFSQMSPKNQNAFIEQQENRRRADRAQNLQERELAIREEEFRTAEVALTLQDPAALAQMTVEQLRAQRPLLGERNYVKLAKAWNEYKGNEAKLSNARVDNDQLNEALIAFGFDPKPKPGNKEAAATVMRARAAVEAALGREQLSKGRELTGPEKQVEIARVLGKSVKEKTFFSYREVPDITVSELTGDAFVELPASVGSGRGTSPAKDRRVYFKDIPTTEISLIKSKLQAAKEPHSDSDILRMYAAGIARTAAAKAGNPAPTTPRAATPTTPSGPRPSYEDIPK